MGHRIIRFVAAYAPHAGYSDNDLQCFYDSLCYIASDARSKGHLCIVGGDFNTQLDIGMRGSLLSEFASAYELDVCNSEGTGTTEASWTFCSYTGIKRRLDCILASSRLHASSCAPTQQIHMNSDHRAVRAAFEVRISRRRRRAKKLRIQRGWKPTFDDQGNPQAYHSSLNQHLQIHTPATLQDRATRNHSGRNQRGSNNLNQQRYQATMAAT